MAKKKAVRARAIPGEELADLTAAETDLVSHMEQGWRLETDSLGGNPVLRSLKRRQSDPSSVREPKHGGGA